jgi:hypothetical protein
MPVEPGRDGAVPDSHHSADLVRLVATFDQRASAPFADTGALVVELDTVERTIGGFDLAHLAGRGARQQAAELVWRLFDLRMRLRERIGEWQRQGLMTEAVQAGLRNTFRALRTLGDIAGELNSGFPRLGEEERARRAFTGADHNTLMPRSWVTGRAYPFRSGDVLLMRGTLHNSAAIARIGDIDSQFSHLAIVYIDEAGRPFVVESLIEEGAIVNTLEHVLDHGLARAVVFRHRDERLAAEAARFIHARVRQSRSGWHPRILYDFTMRLASYRRLYCSKLVRQAYDAASGGTLKLPTFPTRLDQGSRDFLARVGVKSRATFAPGDMELEPGFDLVAEWQDYRATSSVRLQDLLMTRLFAWMEQDGYVFKETFVIHLIGVLGKLSSYLSDEAKTLISDVVPKVPINMRRRTIATIAMLHKTADPLYKELVAREAESVARRGRPLSQDEVFAHLDAVRAASPERIGYLVPSR